MLVLGPAEVGHVLDIANVEVQARLRGHGLFSALLASLVALAPVDAIRIEAVYNERLAAKLAREGWCVEGRAERGNYYTLTRAWHSSHP